MITMYMITYKMKATDATIIDNSYASEKQVKTRVAKLLKSGVYCICVEVIN